jgi:hypothetical protein
LIFVPPASLLFLAAVSVGVGISRRSYASPFATGYLLLGGLASLAVSLDFAAGTNGFLALLPSIRGLLDPSLAPGVPESRITLPSHSVFDGWLGDILLVGVCALPQLAFGMIGGGLACRYGLAITVSRR